MENPIYIALSRQTALQRQMNMVANNIANMNTTGFKNQKMLFQEFVDRPAIGEKISLVQDYNTMRDLRAGPIQSTNNPLDVALQGDGYFTVETMSGPRFTRAGHFRLNNDNELVEGNGLPVLGDNDNRIQIPQGAKTIEIKGDGTIMADNVQVARIKVVRFDREQFMKETAGGLYVTDEEPQPAPETKVAQGMLEQSNVQPVVEMTQMIEILRQYQSNQKIMEAEHERQRTAIGKLGKVSPT